MIKCRFCGHDNVPGAAFCRNCGAQIPQAVQVPQTPQAHRGPDPYYGQPPPPAQYQQQNPAYGGAPQAKPADAGPISKIVEKAKSMPLMKILMIALPVLVVIVAAIIVIPMLSGSSTDIVKGSITVFGNRNEVFISGNNNAKITIDGEIHSIQRNMDETKAAILVDYSYSSGGPLYYVTASKSTKIADDVLAFRISDNGGAVAYLTDHDSRNEIATLFLYDTSSSKSTRITEDAWYEGYGEMRGICLSPDGKTVTYISDTDPSDNEFAGYIKVGSRAAEKIGTYMYAVAVSNGGKNLYYIRGTEDGRSESLHVRSGRNENRLISDISGRVSLRFNRDYSQVIFNSDGRAYISVNGAEKERIGGSSVYSFLLPVGTQSKSGSSGTASTTVYGLRTLTNLVVINEDGLAYIDNKLEANRIASSSDNRYSAFISDNGKTLIFITNNGHLASIDPTKPNADRREIGRNVETFVASNDGKTLYFVNNDDELYCVKGTRNPEKIADDVASFLAMPFNSTRVFFLVDYGRRGGEMYYSNNGGRRTKVASGDEVTVVWSTRTSVFFGNYDEEVFRSNGNEKFTRFAEEIDYMR